MAVRTVRVRLELDRDDFKQGLRDAAAETRDFDGEVQGLGDSAGRTGVELKDAGDTAKKLGDDARSSARDVDAMGSSTRKLGNDVKDTGQQVSSAKQRLSELTAALQNVDQELARTKATMAELAAEFGRTGNTDLMSQFVNEKNSSAALSRFRNDLSKMRAEVEKEFNSSNSGGGGLLNFALDEWATNLAVKTGEGLEKGFASLGDAVAQSPIAAALIAAAALAVVPVTAIIGSAVGAGITVAFGGGVLALGIRQAISDPGVKSAWSELGNDAKAALSQGGSSFVQPMIDGAAKVQAAFDEAVPHIESAFQAIGPTVDDLFTGAAGFVRNLAPALDKLASFSAPFLQDLADWLPELSSHLASFVDKITSAGPGLRFFFNDLLSFINQVIDWFGTLISVSSRVYSALDGLMSLLSGDLPGAVSGLAGAFGNIGTAAQHVTINNAAVAAGFHQTAAAAQTLGLGVNLAADQFSKLSGQISQTAQTTDVLAGQMSDRLLNSMLSLDQANLAYHQSLTAVTEAVKQNGHETDINKAKGQANTAVVLQAVAANVKQYDALISAGASAQDAAAAYDANTNALAKQMRQAGFTQGQIDGLIGKYKNVPANVDTNIVLHGLTDAINNLNTTLRLINGLHDKTVNINVVTHQSLVNMGNVGTSKSVALHHQGAKGAIVSYASGGVDYRSRSGILEPSNPGTFLAGEPQTGGEVLTPRLGISDERGLALANVAAGWHGGRVVQDGPRAGAVGAVNVKNTLTVGGGTGLTPAELLLANWFHNAVLHGQITLKTDDAGWVRVA